MSHKTKTKKPDKLPLRRVLQNNFYILRIIQKEAPAFLWADIVLDLLWSVIEFLSGSFLLKVVVDRMDAGESIGTLATVVLIVCAIHLVVWYIQQWFWSVYGEATFVRISAAITKMLIRQMSAVELSRYEDPAYYEKYIKAMNEANWRSFRVLWSLERLFGQVFSLSANSILLFTIDPWLVLFAFVPFAVGFLKNIRNKVAFKENEELQKVEWRRSYIQRTFYLNDYAKEMRLTGMSDKYLSDNMETVEDFKRIKRKFGPRLAALDYTTRISHEVITILGAGLYAVYATLVRGTMGVGDCLVVLNSIGSVSGYLQNLVANLASFHEHALYIENLRSFVEYVPKIQENPEGLAATHAPLVAEHVRYRYEGAEQDALRDVSVRINPGETIALVGQNGSGKSTFVKLLLHLYEPTDGAITLSGRPMNDYNLTSWRGHFNVVFQDYRIFALTVAENVLMRPLSADPEARAADYARAEAALRAAGAWERVEKMPHGMDTMLTREFDDKGVVLSGGEAQKVVLARVFAGDAPVVILDEPTSALDPVAEYKVFDNMAKACRDRTLIFISHRLSSAVSADRVYLFDGGRIMESGTHHELMEKNGHYADMFRKQAESYRATDGELPHEEVTV